MSTVCWCGRPECPSTTFSQEQCTASLRAEVERLRTENIGLRTRDKRAIALAKATRNCVVEFTRRGESPWAACVDAAAALAEWEKP